MTNESEEVIMQREELPSGSQTDASVQRPRTQAEYDGLALLRKPFPENQIGQLPKGTKVQNQCPAADKRNCNICGGWHHPKVRHLSYVGHAAITDRLLDADPMWDWEPMAYTESGLPLFDPSGGLWIKLTVCGVVRLGYGHARSKGGEDSDPGNREKEVIGDALRNAGMRFGMGLELWHKGDLHADDEEKEKEKEEVPERVVSAVENAQQSRWEQAGNANRPTTAEDEAVLLLSQFETAKTLQDLNDIKEAFRKAWGRLRGVKGLQDSIVAMSTNAHNRIKNRPAIGPT